jgi:hypothetical protein
MLAAVNSQLAAVCSSCLDQPYFPASHGCSSNPFPIQLFEKFKNDCPILENMLSFFGAVTVKVFNCATSACGLKLLFSAPT